MRKDNKPRIHSQVSLEVSKFKLHNRRYLGRPYKTGRFMDQLTKHIGNIWISDTPPGYLKIFEVC